VGVQLVAPAFLRKNAYCLAAPVPPLAVAVQVIVVPWLAKECLAFVAGRAAVGDWSRRRRGK